MQRTALHFFCCLVWLLAPALAAAQSELLNLVPEDALGVVIINHLNTSSAKIEKLAQQLQIPIPSPLAAIKSTTGIQQGIDESKPAGLFAMQAPSDSKPAGILLVPVTDYKQFVAQFHPADAAARIVEVQIAGAQALVGDKGGYAAFALPVHKALLESVLDNKTSITASLRPLSTWLKSQEFAALVAPSGVRQVAEQLGTKLIETAGQLEKMGEQQKAAAKMLEQYRKLFEVASREVTHFGIGLRIDESMGLHLSSRTMVRKGGSLSQLLADAKREGDLLGGIPKDAFVVAAGLTIPPALIEKFSDFAAQMAPFNPALSQLDPKQTAELGTTISQVMRDTMQGVKRTSIVIGATKPGEPMYGRAIAIMSVDDSAAFLKRYKTALERMSKAMAQAGSKAAQYEVKAVTVDGLDGLELTMDMTAAAAGPGAEVTARMMEKMFGPGGKTKVHIAAADKTTVLMAYVSQENLKRGLQAFRSHDGGLAADSQVQLTAELLPKNAHCVIYISPRHAIEWMKVIVSTSVGKQLPIQIPEFPETPPIGATATFYPVGMATDLVVPLEVTKAIGQYAAQLRPKAQPHIEPPQQESQ